ncbi:hypothetical protein KBB96_09665 [Luteolibacter ambystomatis]|uniref:Uncharacterized protein n=1 Tax=Luteolibacter ambystomatis TaxID=2824561 RepID=A0A975J378_9BACT|nr:hypothetical protein [Luteolibacter ambystomatis]QUE53147.1 hypothetical protein KBB96_09665 [Luteolibacter ambystomatis]
MKATMRTTCWLALGLLGIFLGRLALQDGRGSQALAFFQQVAAVAQTMENRAHRPAADVSAADLMMAESSTEAVSPQALAQQQRRVKDRMAELTESLDLDVEQVAKLRPIVEHAEASMTRAMERFFDKEPRTASASPPPSPGEVMRESHELADSQITALLRPDQEEKFQTWLQERKERIRHVANRRNMRPPGNGMQQPVQDA